MWPRLYLVVIILVYHSQEFLPSTGHNSNKRSVFTYAAPNYDSFPKDQNNESSSVIVCNASVVQTALQGERNLSKSHLKFALLVYGSLASQSENNNTNLIYSPVLLADYLSSVTLALNSNENNKFKPRQKLTPETDPSSSQDSWSREDQQQIQAMTNTIRGRETNLLQQLRKVLHLANTSLHTITSIQGNIQTYLQSSYLHNSLRTCTKHFLHSTEKLQQRYLFLRRKVSLDLQNTPFLSKIEINRELNRCSGGELREVVQQEPASWSRHLLAGGGVLNTNWRIDFNSSLTFDKGLFYTTDNRRLEIPVMVGRQRVPLGYSRLLETRVLELPLDRRRASLFIFLPDQTSHGLSNLEKNLTAETIRNLLATLKDEIVNIRLPRFRVESTPPVAAALRSLGLTDLFRSRQRGGGARQPLEFSVDDLIYKMAFEVEESGRFKIASSNLSRLESPKEDGNPQSSSTPRKDTGTAELPNLASSVTPGSDIPALSTFGEQHFQVDHPFLFFIWDYFHSYVVMMGRVTHPQSLIQHR